LHRSFLVETSGKSFITPFFVPAISSTKANWTIEGYVGLIENVGYPSFLVSAYDIYKLEEKKNLEKILSKYAENKILYFLDNGNFEAYWYRDNTWSMDKLRDVLNETSPDFCFSFDVFGGKKTEEEKHTRETITSIAKTAGIQKTGSTIALLHANSGLLPRIARKVVDYINPEIVAVPERELGSSVFERAQTIKNIRDELDKTKKLILLHILGTGNPLSILIYTFCGADMFDSLDWSSTFIDLKSGQEYHFSQKDLVSCECAACRMKNVPYYYQVMAHNLIFYSEFVDKIRDSIRNEEIDSFLKTYLHDKSVSTVKKIAGLK
jgi:queuine/archaeosine tRNA-ribosyltransferase